MINSHTMKVNEVDIIKASHQNTNLARPGMRRV